MCSLFDLHRDISKGREIYPIKVMQRQHRTDAVANALPQFQYITQSIVLHNADVQIDRRIAQMRVCACVDK